MTNPRLILLSKPLPLVLERMAAAVSQHGLDRRLGAAMFEACNWHQSWSGRYEDNPSMRARLERIGSRLASAKAFTQPFNRIGGTGHWTLLGRGRPQGYRDVLHAAQSALQQDGLDAPGHAPHVTICYWPPTPLKSVPILPIACPIDEILLVVGKGSPYRYETLASWKLQTPQESRQLSLF